MRRNRWSRWEEDDDEGKFDHINSQLTDILGALGVLRRRIDALEGSIDDHTGSDGGVYNITVAHPNQSPTTGNTATAPGGTTENTVGVWGAYSYGTGLYNGSQF